MVLESLRFLIIWDKANYQMKKPLYLLSFLVLWTFSGFSQTLDLSKMSKKDGFMPFYLDEEKGKIYLEISSLDKEFLYVNALTAGVGSNDIGLDRGQLGDDRVVGGGAEPRAVFRRHDLSGAAGGADEPGGGAAL